MKTSYELAMERLDRSAPVKKLTDEQKDRIAEVDSVYAAKLAEKDVTLNGRIAELEALGDLESVAKLKAELAADRHRLEAEREKKKDRIRKGA